MILLIISIFMISDSSSDCHIPNCKTCSIESSKVCVDCNSGFAQNNNLGCIKLDSNDGNYTIKGEFIEIMNQLEKTSSIENNFTNFIDKAYFDKFDFEKFSEECENCEEFGVCNECKTNLYRIQRRHLDSTCGTGLYYEYGQCYSCISNCYDCYNGHSCYDCDYGYTYRNYECVYDSYSGSSGSSSSSSSSGSSGGGSITIAIGAGSVSSFCFIIM
jgi:hypothetical protein